jgi:hypothetical protein
MPDHPQSTEQSPYLVSNVFRESFLAIFERTDHEAALRLLGGLAHDLVFESRELLEASDRSGEPIWRADIRGAIGDFRQAADQLKDVARDLDEAAGGRELVRVMLAIADAATEVEPIAARLDAALAAYLTARGEEH